MEGTSLEEQIEELAQKIEQAQLQLQANALFQKNMALFQEMFPIAYHLFTNYVPKKWRVGYDKNNKINLFNVETNEPIYGDDPLKTSQEQVRNYIQDPQGFNITVGKTFDATFAHLQTISELTSGQAFVANHETILKPVGVMMVIGTGLCLHIDELIKNLNIKNMIIVEPEYDFFYASLLTHDWVKSAELAKQRGTALHITQYISLPEFTSHIRTLLLADFMQPYMANSYFYKHHDTTLGIDASNQLLNELQIFFNSNGFIEDEQISVAHTYWNLKRNRKFFYIPRQQQVDYPLFIIGNGPSLEDLLPFIKENQNNAIIISCGSSLGTLRANGISPDFHCEMERCYLTKELLDEDYDKDYFSSIKFIGLNTVPDDVFALFEEGFIALKDNDANEDIVHDLYSESIVSLRFMNPTVTNMALSFALNGGFETICLLGVDLGSKNRKQHHAKSSAYYKKTSSLSTTPVEAIDQIQVKGNFRKKIWSNKTLDFSRINMIHALKELATPWQKVYNLSDGAYIEGATPKRAKEVELPLNSDKKSILNAFCENMFQHVPAKRNPTVSILKNEYFNEAIQFLKNTRLESNLNSLEDIIKETDRIINKIKYMPQESSKKILAGEFNTLFLVLLQSCYQADLESNLAKTYHNKAMIINRFIDYCYDLMKNHIVLNDRQRGDHLSQWLKSIKP
jgi:hypothetical protein